MLSCVDDPAERLLAELVEAALGARSRRARVAVTAGEYELVRSHLLEHDGRFYGRIKNVPLVIDENAASPRFTLELAEGEAR
ncbi:MAG TPA: hypothetical protein VGF39_03890 [Stellaceae bacterium]|jgi:hypothetical protein